jgi:DNA-binding SARP family transcriptional activator
MEQIVAEVPQGDSRLLGAELLRQGERCALSGFPDQAEAILAQAWSLVEQHDEALSGRIAWHIACLRLCAQDYTAAAKWFRRVDSAPVLQGALWPEQQRTFVELCLRLSCGRAALDDGPTPSTPALAPLTITNLGSFQVVRGQEILSICRARKAISLFRYLLTRDRRSAQREELIEVLWPGSAPREATHSLHVAVSILRRYLDTGVGSYLLHAAGHYAINPATTLHDDSRAFVVASERAEQHWHMGDLIQAQELYIKMIAGYRGDYFVDEQDPDWALAERERLLTRYLLALERLSQIWISQGHFDAAAECCQQLLDRDAFREDMHCQLIRCYLALGRRGDALRQFQRCAVILEQELGLQPMLETQKLLQQINGA